MNFINPYDIIKESLTFLGINMPLFGINYLTIKGRVGDVKTKTGLPFDFGDIIYDGKKESINDWKLIKTIGDGSCLLHSLLSILSHNYLDLGDDDKKKLVSDLRKRVLVPLLGSKLTEEEKVEIESDSIWLTDAVGEKIAAQFGFGLIILRLQQSSTGVPVPNITIRDGPTNRYIMIANLGGLIDNPNSGKHYEPVVISISNSIFDYSIIPMEKKVMELLEKNNMIVQPSPLSISQSSTRSYTIRNNRPKLRKTCVKRHTNTKRCNKKSYRIRSKPINNYPKSRKTCVKRNMKWNRKKECSKK
jgi:hypothetical protein